MSNGAGKEECKCYCHSGSNKCCGACCENPGEAHGTRQEDLLAGELLSKKAGKRARPQRQGLDILDGDGLS